MVLGDSRERVVLPQNVKIRRLRTAALAPPKDHEATYY